MDAGLPHGTLLSRNHTREIVSALLLGEADLALSLQDPHHPGIKTEALASGSLMALCPLDSPEGAQSGTLALTDISSQIIALEESDPLGMLVTDAFEAANAVPRSRVTVQTYQLARALVEAGAGVTVVDPFTASCADPMRVRIRPLEEGAQISLFLLTAATAPLAQSSRRLVRFVASVAQARLKALGV